MAFPLGFQHKTVFGEQGLEILPGRRTVKALGETVGERPGLFPTPLGAGCGRALGSCAPGAPRRLLGRCVGQVGIEGVGGRVSKSMLIGQGPHDAVPDSIVVAGLPGAAVHRRHPVQHDVQVGMGFVAMPHDERLVLTETRRGEGFEGNLLHSFGCWPLIDVPGNHHVIAGGFAARRAGGGCRHEACGRVGVDVGKVLAEHPGDTVRAHGPVASRHQVARQRVEIIGRRLDSRQHGLEPADNRHHGCQRIPGFLLDERQVHDVCLMGYLIQIIAYPAEFPQRRRVGLGMGQFHTAFGDIGLQHAIDQRREGHGADVTVDVQAGVSGRRDPGLDDMRPRPLAIGNAFAVAPGRHTDGFLVVLGQVAARSAVVQRPHAAREAPLTHFVVKGIPRHLPFSFFRLSHSAQVFCL